VEERERPTHVRFEPSALFLMLTPPQAQLRMLANEGWALRQLILPDGGPEKSGLLCVALAPFLALYTVEVFDLLKRHEPTLVLEGFNGGNPFMRSVRARSKLYAGDDENLMGIAKLLTRCEEQSYLWFNSHHRGMLAHLKRWLQCDLGIFTCDGHLVLTSHVGLVHSSFPDADDESFAENSFAQLGRMNHDFGVQVGQILGPVTDALRPHRTADALPDPAATLRLLRRSDCKSKVAYDALRAQLGTERGHAAPFTWLMCQVNAAHRWIRNVLPSRGGLGFRIRFLTAFHSLDALRLLNASCGKFRDRPLAELCSALVSSADGKAIRKLRELRNSLAHYQGCATRDSADADPLEALVPNASPFTLFELEDVVDRHLEAMSTRFKELTPRGSRPRLVSDR
jgi:hypothetical protein